MTVKTRAAGGLLLMGLCLASALQATQVRFFRQQSTADFVDGEFDGMALDAQGALRPALHFERFAEIEEPFVFSSRPRGEGWVVGTGNSGLVLEVGPDGRVETSWTAPEPEIFAVWVDADGTTFVGSSPAGKVYRLSPEGGEAIFDPEETYIWDLARAPWGDLLVATGDTGKLYAIGPDGASRLLFESGEAHLRSLHPLADSVLIGTAGEGLILSVEASGRVRTLFDADQTEVTAFADDGSGSWFAAAVAAEASLTQRATESSSGAKEKDDDEVSIEVTATPAASTSGDRSSIVRGGAGETRVVASLGRETVYALGWIEGRLWLGTGVEGNVYSLNEGRLSLETSVPDRQVVGLYGGTRPILITTNGAALHRAKATSSAPGIYSSKILDAGAMARFGTLTWRGEAVARDAIEFSVRSGLSSEPDATWSDWSVPAAGDAFDLSASPPGRFIQWRLEISPQAGEGARVLSVTLSYRQENTAPTIKSFNALEPGQVLVPSSFNPGDQIYQPAHPDRSGIFTTLEPSAATNGGRLKPLWRRGFQTLKWDAADANDDTLLYALSFRAEGSSFEFTAMAEEIEEDYYSFDATVLPDGLYRFRLEASDGKDNSPERALTAERISEPVVIDHTPPVVLVRKAGDGWLEAALADDLSPIRAAEVSVDGRAWSDATSVDGLLDTERETVRVEMPAEARLVLLRLTDAAFNVATYDLLEEQ